MKWAWRWLLIVCLFAALRGVGIAWHTLADLQRYRALETAGSPIIRSGVNGVLGAALLAVSWGLWWRRQRAYRAVLPLLLVYWLFDFVWLAGYAQADYDQKRLGFVGVTSVLLACFTIWNWLRLHKIFGEDND